VGALRDVDRDASSIRRSAAIRCSTSTCSGSTPTQRSTS
jgi:hypothetical protein